MNSAVHYYHTACLCLDLGLTPDDAIQVARYNQMTDWACPRNLTPEYWPDATGFRPMVTQLDVGDAARLLAGESWWPGFTACHRWHFGNGQGPYTEVEFRWALMALHELLEGGKYLPVVGGLLHLCQDFASHAGYCGYPTASNLELGDSRAWYRKLISRQNAMGHVLRPEVDRLEVSRANIVNVTRRIIAECGGKSESVHLLESAANDADLIQWCKAWWRDKTQGREIPPFHAPSPKSKEWREWCGVDA